MKLGFKRIVLFVVIICMLIAIIIGCVCRKNTNKHTEATDKIVETQAISSEEDDISKDKHSNFVDATDENEITATTESVTPETNVQEDDNNSNLVNLGNFKLTAYCSCSICCGEWAYNRPIDENGNEIVYGSTGERLIAGISIAVDPDIIPYNSNVIINGRIYTAHDTGGAINGNRIDVYFNNHQDALNFGVQYADVYVIQ